MKKPSVALIDNYDSYTWNLFQLLWEIAGTRPAVVRNDETTVDELLAGGFTHFVLSPGPGTPARPRDFGLCRELIERTEVPCLGVCLGHEGIAHVHGAAIVPAPQVMHGRKSAIYHEGNELFAGVPQGFQAVRYHSLAVGRPLPDELRVTAWTEDGMVMALAHRTRPLYGVQFHPESVETECGDLLLANFLGLPCPPHPRVVDLEPGQAAGSRSPVSATPCHWQEIPLRLPPDELFDALYADRPYSFWLDSARRAYGMGRYSYMGAPEDQERVIVRAYAGTNRVEEERVEGTRHFCGSIFEYLRARGMDHVPFGPSPVPFAGGFVGYLGYGTKGSTGIGRPGEGHAPDAELIRADRLLAIDHDTGRGFLIAVAVSKPAARVWFDAVINRIEQAMRTRKSAHPHVIEPMREIQASVDYVTYAKHFAMIQEWLHAGESYEACYTYRITAACSADPLTVYRRLRRVNPAPYGAYLRLGDRCVLSTSPERFATVTADRWIETKPIKGTAPRGTDPESDERARRELATGQKTRSENLMIVDLLRNDLGQVCDPSTVHVPHLMAVESYATVHQLVSTIRGRLHADVTAIDCVEALFPGGSMTGAPKKRTVELLDDLETVARGIYSGCLGFFGYDGQADWSIIIRTIVWEGDHLSIGVGGAITVMSEVESEYMETRLKAGALLATLGVPHEATIAADRLRKRSCHA